MEGLEKAYLRKYFLIKTRRMVRRWLDKMWKKKIMWKSKWGRKDLGLFQEWKKPGTFGAGRTSKRVGKKETGECGGNVQGTVAGWRNVIKENQFV